MKSSLNTPRNTSLGFVIGRDLITQTKTDRYSNVPKPQVFLAGLRGGGMSVPTDMTKVDLTLDVDQN